jgi:hypothetical protein
MRYALLFAFPLAVACSDGRGGGTQSGSNPDLGIAHGGPVDGGGGANPDGAIAPSPDLAAPIDGYGNVGIYLTQASTSGTAYSSSSVMATFYEAVPAAPSGFSCTQSTIGGCLVSTCTGTSTGGGTTPPEAAAGDVTISGGSETITLHTDVGTHETQYSAALWWNGGQALSIYSTGATVGAFTDSLIVPEQIVVTSPYLPSSGSVAIVRTSGLALDWTGGVHGEAVFILGQSWSGGSTSAICRFPASQTHAAMDTAVLQKFAPGLASFSASTNAQHEQRVGNWQITSTAYFNSIYDDGRSAAGQLQLN